MGDKKTNIADLMRQALPWTAVELTDAASVPTGDMPGDKVQIGPEHIDKSRIIFPRLLDLLIPVVSASPYQRATVAVCGGSGVGKSEIASLLSFYLNRLGVGAYTLSGDNYPHRIPQYNDAERLRVFRKSGLIGLIAYGQYQQDRWPLLKALQVAGDDANPARVKQLPWLALYQQCGRNGLQNYLGTPNEIDFAELSAIVSQFHNGADTIFLKRMGREETELYYQPVDFAAKHVLVIEWTHGNNRNLQGVDTPILLNSTPQETLAHRRSRHRDGGTDSAFTTMVLAIEQELLVSQAAQAKLILSKRGEVLSYGEFMRRMQEQNGQ